MKLIFIRRERAPRLAMFMAPIISFIFSALESFILFALLGKPARQELYSLLLEPFLSWYNLSEGC